MELVCRSWSSSFSLPESPSDRSDAWSSERLVNARSSIADGKRTTDLGGGDDSARRAGFCEAEKKSLMVCTRPESGERVHGGGAVDVEESILEGCAEESDSSRRESFALGASSAVELSSEPSRVSLCELLADKDFLRPLLL